MTLAFEIPGRSVPWGRPRAIGRTGRFGRTPPKTRAWEAHVSGCALEAMQAHKSRRGRLIKSPFPLDGPLELYVDFIFEQPKSAAKRSTPCVKPDIDNAVKAVMDGLVAAGALVDDSRIVFLSARKLYGSPERVKITLSVMDPQAIADLSLP